jgi:MFS family permease
MTKPLDDATEAPVPGNQKWLSRNVWVLSWVSFAQDAASEMLYPLMPILLTSIFGAPAAIVGMIEGLAEGIAAATKLASAWLNRFIPRKWMVGIGYGLAGLGKVLVAAAGSWPIVLVGRLTDRVGKGMRSAPRDALLVQGSAKSHRGRIIGFHRTADTMGAVLGPVLALLLLAAFNNHVQSVLWFAVIPAITSTLLVLLVKDNQPSGRSAQRIEAAKHPDAPVVALTPEPLPAKLRLVLTAVIGFGIINFPDALVLLHVSQVGFSVTEVVGAYLLYNISYAAMNFPAGMLADKMRPSLVYAMGLLCFAITYGGMSLTKDHNWTLLLVVIYGGYAACNDTVGKSWVSKLAPESRQLWAQSLLQGFSGFSVLVAGLWAGACWTLGAGLGVVPLAISGGLALVAAVAMAVSRL